MAPTQREAIGPQPIADTPVWARKPNLLRDYVQLLSGFLLTVVTESRLRCVGNVVGSRITAVSVFNSG